MASSRSLKKRKSFVAQKRKRVCCDDPPPQIGGGPIMYDDQAHERGGITTTREWGEGAKNGVDFACVAWNQSEAPTALKIVVGLRSRARSEETVDS
jgi:hypothetical protein